MKMKWFLLIVASMTGSLFSSDRDNWLRLPERNINFQKPYFTNAATLKEYAYNNGGRILSQQKIDFQQSRPASIAAPREVAVEIGALHIKGTFELFDGNIFITVADKDNDIGLNQKVLVEMPKGKVFVINGALYDGSIFGLTVQQSSSATEPVVNGSLNVKAGKDKEPFYFLLKSNLTITGSLNCNGAQLSCIVLSAELHVKKDVDMYQNGGRGNTYGEISGVTLLKNGEIDAAGEIRIDDNIGSGNIPEEILINPISKSAREWYRNKQKKDS